MTPKGQNPLGQTKKYKIILDKLNIKLYNKSGFKLGSCMEITLDKKL